jgi:hypothetical protein
MNSPFTLILAIAALGFVYVVVPVAAGAYRRFRGTKLPTCPATHAIAAVKLDAKHAALTAAVGAPDLRVKTCSRWPEHRNCGQECVRELDDAPVATSLPLAPRV